MGVIARLKSVAGGRAVATSIAVSATVIIPEDTNRIEFTGTDTITSLQADSSTRGREVTFRQASGATTFTNTEGTTTANQMDLGGSNLTLAAGDQVTLYLRSDGVWTVSKPVARANAGTYTVASAATLTVPDNNDYFVLTGTETVTALTATGTAGYRRVTFIGGTSAGVTFTHTDSPSANQMFLGGANRLLREQQVISLILQPDSSWFIDQPSNG